jgi:hypothetical protein
MISGCRPYLTKKDVLSRVSEEDIFSLIGVPYTEEKICNPFREDHNPKCSFSLYRNPYAGRPLLHFCDLSGYFGSRGCLDPVELVQWIHNFKDFQKLYYYIIDNVVPTGIKNTLKEKTVPIDIKIIPREWRKDDYFIRHGFDPDILKKEGIYILDAYYSGTTDNPTFLRKNIYGNPKFITTIGYRLPSGRIKLYFPTRKERRFHTNCMSDDVWGSPFIGDTLWVTKSPKDYLFLKYMVGKDQVCATQSESVILDFPGYEEVIYLYDSDKPGILASLRALKQGHQTRTILNPYCKDPFEMLEKYGEKEAVNYFKWIK